jgi:hypothetical protein
MAENQNTSQGFVQLILLIISLIAIIYGLTILF